MADTGTMFILIGHPIRVCHIEIVFKLEEWEALFQDIFIPSSAVCVNAVGISEKLHKDWRGRRCWFPIDIEG